jgi:G2/mitotic-specific cyclin-B, other
MSNLNPVNYVPTPTNQAPQINQNQRVTSIYRQKKNTSFHLEYPTPYINQQYFPIQPMRSNSKSKTKANITSYKTNSQMSRNNSSSRVQEKTLDHQQSLYKRRSSAKPMSAINLCVIPSSIKPFSNTNKENVDMNTLNRIDSMNAVHSLKNNYLSENLTSNNDMILENMHQDENMFSEAETTDPSEGKCSKQSRLSKKSLNNFFLFHFLAGVDINIHHEADYILTEEKIPVESIIPESNLKDVNMNHNPMSNDEPSHSIFIPQQNNHQQDVFPQNISSNLMNTFNNCYSTIPLHLQELIEDIYTNLLYEENSLNLKNSLLIDYMPHQSDINEQMRAILLDWMVEVHLKFHLKDETLFLAVHLIDRYLCLQAIQRSRLQLLGVACLMIACKQEEILTPHVKDFVYITDKAYSKEEVLDMEKEVLKVLEFNLLFPSSNRFYQLLAQFFKFNKKQFMFGRYLLETCLIGYRMTKYLPSMLAASCAYIVMKFFNFSNYQIVYAPFILGESSNPHSFKVSQLKDCAREIIYLLENLGSSTLTAVKRKFSEREFCQVAAINLN